MKSDEGWGVNQKFFVWIELDKELDEDLYDEELFRFTDSSITYEQDEDWWRLRGVEPKVLCVDCNKHDKRSKDQEDDG